MDIAKGISDILRVLTDAKVTVPLFVASLTVILLPDDVISRLGLERNIFGFAVIVTAAFNLPHIWEWLKKKAQQKRTMRRAKRRLETLTALEKRILSEFMARRSRTANLDITNGVVNGLIEAGIMWRSSNMTSGWASPPTVFAHNLFDWSWDELSRRPELLESAENSEQT